ncbi:hypothetical protein [Massilia sp.]|uniref:hypothetical protein n=1 Tax=Massilia sp. TaxID=1882437 RepID=UPI00289981E7|nr:hypothetical protein [Massilia sp.]
MENQILTVELFCPYHTNCIANGRDMPIEITIKNTSSSVIGFPLAYMNRLGPSGRLFDNITKTEISLRTGMPDWRFKDIFTKMHPGESVKMSTILYIDEIHAFKQEYVDITAEIGIVSNIRIDDQVETTKFSGYSTIQILDKKTYRERSRTISP